MNTVSKANVARLVANAPMASDASMECVLVLALQTTTVHPGKFVPEVSVSLVAVVMPIVDEHKSVLVVVALAFPASNTLLVSDVWTSTSVPLILAIRRLFVKTLPEVIVAPVVKAKLATAGPAAAKIPANVHVATVIVLTRPAVEPTPEAYHAVSISAL